MLEYNQCLLWWIKALRKDAQIFYVLRAFVFYSSPYLSQQSERAFVPSALLQTEGMERAFISPVSIFFQLLHHIS